MSLSTSPNFPQLEESIEKFWIEHKTFEKSVEQRPASKSYVFYDGPPFATGLPHYGHLLGSTSKDVIPRYWTMKGHRVERVWGWDCHGLPIENMIEGQLKIKGGKKGIEALGVDKFNQACRAEVMRLDSEWEKIISRLGRWVDFKNNYKTMDDKYMESVWWGFKQLYDKDLVYQGRKVVMYCARCATPLSNFEIAMDNSYADTEDFSLYVAFKKKNSSDEYFLAWTTTPWTLPGNMALAVHPQATYSLVEYNNKKYWLASDRVEAMFNAASEYSVLDTVPASELIGQEYEPLFEYVKDQLGSESSSTNWTVLSGEFVSLADGTGLVHTAALFGEDDYALALEKNLSLVPTLDENGLFLPFVTQFAGQFFKKAEQGVVDDLQARELVVRVSKEVHSYPFCYRCNTPLFYNAVPAWFINVQKLKPELLKQNENMNWFPQHLKQGRFGKGLETAPDWNISRSRYWGTPMPIWQSADGSQRRVIGSLKELQEWAVEPQKAAALTDLHSEFLDAIEVWVDDKKTVKGTRVSEVFDCWVESGSMPFASIHYPFENKEKFESSYPAQFVSEYIAQTRAWFYTMHVMSVGVFGKHAVDNTLTTGTILAEDGTKMSKSKKNYPDPMKLINTYGVDSLRLYLMSSPVMKAENLNFNEKEVSEIRKSIFLVWWNMASFYTMYAGDTKVDLSKTPQPTHVIDRWVLSRMESLVSSVTKSMDSYDVVRASRSLMEFVTELSTWYVRRSRDRFKADDPSGALEVFGFVLVKLAQMFAPFAPFFSETMYHQLVDNTSSIHLTEWPQSQPELLDQKLEQDMIFVRELVEKVHAKRKDTGIKVRQPLAAVTISTSATPLSEELTEVLLEEVNVKKTVWQKSSDSNTQVELDTTLTQELKDEGEARELLRSIQALRKTAGLSREDHAMVTAPKWPESYKQYIEEKTNTTLELGPELKLV